MSLDITGQPSSSLTSRIPTVVGFKGCPVMSSNSLGAETATMDQWQDAVSLLPKGYRIKGAWFYDAHGNRTNLPDARMSERQIDILTGVIPVA